tara:strand:- start:1154 stop:1258 length:105 start_codon:yes stop_codon:yes gene_type:complete
MKKSPVEKSEKKKSCIENNDRKKEFEEMCMKKKN